MRSSSLVPWLIAVATLTVAASSCGQPASQTAELTPDPIAQSAPAPSEAELRTLIHDEVAAQVDAQCQRPERYADAR